MSFRGIWILFCIILRSSILPIFAQNPYNLQHALRTAKENNPILKTQQFNRVVAEADIITAQLRPNPKLNNQTLFLGKPSIFPTNTDWFNPQNRQVWWQLTKIIQTPALRKSKIEYFQQNGILSQKIIKKRKEISYRR